MLVFLASMASLVAPGTDAPIALHPDNPRYFLFRGKPTVLITGTEHYGAVLNTAFDHASYLDTLARDGLNLTRTFSGAYMEHPAAFNIAGNTLAPAEGRLVCPWARGDQPGYAAGGNRFDLTRWDGAYFARLRDFVRQASDRGIVVEYVLFCPFYGEEQWALSPMNAANNVNGVGAVGREEVYTLGDEPLQRVQEAFVRKVVTELAGFDNLYYEICNEPYFGGVTLAWQHRIADVIAATEAGLGVRHLIAQNIANGSGRVSEPHPAVSILNFHYAAPPVAVAENYALGLAIGDDETGFRGTEDATYRTEAWQFLLAGGTLFDHLDYSFSVGHEDGTFHYPDSQPGGGSTELRRQFGILKRFMESLDFLRMAPDPEAVAGPLPEGVSCHLLSQPGACYAAYIDGRGLHELPLRLAEGEYVAEWISPLTGEVLARDTVRAAEGPTPLRCPDYGDGVALRLHRG